MIPLGAAFRTFRLLPSTTASSKHSKSVSWALGSLPERAQVVGPVRSEIWPRSLPATNIARSDGPQRLHRSTARSDGTQGTLGLAGVHAGPRASAPFASAPGAGVRHLRPGLPSHGGE